MPSFLISQPPYASVGPFETRAQAITWLHTRGDLLGMHDASVLACYTPGEVELAYVELANAEDAVARGDCEMLLSLKGHEAIQAIPVEHYKSTALHGVPVYAIGEPLTGYTGDGLYPYRSEPSSRVAPLEQRSSAWFTPVRHALALLLRGRG